MSNDNDKSNDESPSPSVGPESSITGTATAAGDTGGGGGAGASTVCADRCSLALDFADEKEAVELEASLGLELEGTFDAATPAPPCFGAPEATTVAVDVAAATAVAGFPSPHCHS